ncbi:hypothetical protein MASR2M79_05620 [Aminivibrio sp.]
MVLENLIFPEPVISLSVEPATKNDKIKLTKGLVALAEEDPTFKVNTDEETSQTIIRGMGELHPEIIVDRLKREFGVDVRWAAPGCLPRGHPHQLQGGGEESASPAAGGSTAMWFEWNPPRGEGV